MNWHLGWSGIRRSAWLPMLQRTARSGVSWVFATTRAVYEPGMVLADREHDFRWRSWSPKDRVIACP